MNLKEQIMAFVPSTEQEAKDKEYFLKWIDTFDDVLTRENEFAHFSSSGFVVNPEHTKMLVVYHKIYDGWIYPGGHADGEQDVLSVAVREVLEETGLNVKVLNKEIFSLNSLPVMAHIKRGKFIPAHTHLDTVFLMESDDSKPLVYREDESKGVKWVDLDNCDSMEMCDYIRPVHRKLSLKLEKMDK